MAEVLSQSQIDALLSSLQDGAAPIEETEKKEEQKYRKYDFYSPKKFTKDKLKLLKGIFDNYARIASSQINSLFRTSSEIEIIAVEEQRYYEFSNALNDNDVLTVVSVGVPGFTKKMPLLLHASQMLMLSMIDRMLGGMGNDDSVDDSYNYTSIELALYKQVMKYIVSVMGDAWSGYINLDIELQRLEGNPSMFQEIGMDETIVIIVMEVTLREASGKINVCLPGNLLTNIFTTIDKRRHSRQGDEENSEIIRNEIMDSIRGSALEVAAKLGTVELNLEDIYNLHPGDVINLGQSKDSSVEVYVESQPWFNGKMGVHKRNVAIKIDERIEQD